MCGYAAGQGGIIVYVEFEEVKQRVRERRVRAIDIYSQSVL